MGLGGIMAILGGLFAAKSGADIYSKLQGYGNLDELLGMAPTQEQLAIVAKAAAEAQRREFSRGVRQSGIDAMRQHSEDVMNDKSTEAAQIEMALGAVARGSEISNILPSGMRPGAIVHSMRANELDAWKKLRDYRPYLPNANLPEQVQTLGSPPQGAAGGGLPGAMRASRLGLAPQAGIRDA